MSRADLQDRASDPRNRRIPYVRPGGVGRAADLGKPDDEAIIYAAGTMEGFVGGRWAESTVRAQCVTPPT